jgi:hypothetical protein
MIRNISFLFSEAKAKLSGLGMSLFYLYVSLSIAAVIGIIFSVSAIVLKFAHVGAATDMTLWELITLMIVCGLMIKLFIRESFTLVGVSSAKQESPANSNVIPFVRRSDQT